MKENKSTDKKKQINKLKKSILYKTSDTYEKKLMLQNIKKGKHRKHFDINYFLNKTNKSMKGGEQNGDTIKNEVKEMLEGDTAENTAENPEETPSQTTTETPAETLAKTPTENTAENTEETPAQTTTENTEENSKNKVPSLKEIQKEVEDQYGLFSRSKKQRTIRRNSL